MDQVDLSIIIPVSSHDLALIGPMLQQLDNKLENLGHSWEVIWSLPELDQARALEESLRPNKKRSRFIYGKEGRACQLNKGAQESRGQTLWFLHIDSKFIFTAKDLKKQLKQIAHHKLYFFYFKFDYPNKALNLITESGVYLRSEVFGLPFGDQGLMLTRDTFDFLKGFDEGPSYGEDHLFVWKAKAHGIKIESTGLSLETSSKKYQTKGWCTTTAKHFRLTWQQAIPQLLRLFIKKRGGS